MILLLSGKYVEQDLRAEFGELPPTFLPVGNKRLYTYQISHIRSEFPGEKIYMTLPKDYEINPWDYNVLVDLNVQIVRIDNDFTLGQSIAFTLASCCNSDDENVVIYYGDTLLRNPLGDLGVNADTIYTAHSDFNYSWMLMNPSIDNSESVFCGVLAITSPQLLIRNLISNNFNLGESFIKYNEMRPFRQEYRQDWLDFGHLNTFYDSKTIVTTERAFNELTITKYFVEKTSKNKAKLHAEANWFENIPESMACYSPMLISHGEIDDAYKYKVEYLYSPTLTELFVYGNHPKAIWDNIINSCFEFINKCSYILCDKANDSFYNSLITKNNQRLSEFIQSNPRFENPVFDTSGTSYLLKDILCEMHKLIAKDSLSSFIHGDFCFSNILYDFKKNDIKVIDPRGINFAGELSIFGDIRYDLAKILHSAIGKYDYIISDRFNVFDDGRVISLNIPDASTDLTEIIKRKFESLSFSYNEIIAITVTLFISMLPLHYDRPDRQLAFIATAINLYKEIKQ